MHHLSHVFHTQELYTPYEPNNAERLRGEHSCLLWFLCGETRGKKRQKEPEAGGDVGSGGEARFVTS